MLGNTAGPDGAVDRTPEWAATICGVPAATIRAFAQLYASSKPTNLMLGIGIGRASRGMNPVRAALCLQAMTGNIGISGGSACGSSSIPSQVSLPNQPGVFGMQDGGSMSSYPWLHAEFKTYDAILMRDDYQSGKITKDQYYRAIGNNINNPAPNIHMIFQQGSNHPGLSQVNVNKGVQAIKAVDMYVTERRHLDGFAMLADVVLPLTEWYEASPSFMAHHRGWTYNKSIIVPQGEARDTNWIRIQLANALGVGDKFAATYVPGFQNTTPDQWNSAMTSYLQTQYAAWAQSDSTKAVIPNPPSWDQLQTNPVVRADLQYPPYIPFSEQISGGKPFGTKSGLIEFYDPNLETFDASKIQAMGFYGVGAPISPMAIWETPEDGYSDPKAATYPLVMIDTHGRYSFFATSGRIRCLKARYTGTQSG